MDLLGFIGNGLGTLANMWSTNKTNKTNMQMQREANETNLAAVRETNQANMDLAEFQYLKNLEQWQRENEYNSPAKQMERLAAAGLNPNLVYQSIGNQAGSSPSYSAPEMKAGQVQAPSIQKYQDFGDFGVGNATRLMNESRISSAQVANMEEQNSLLRIDAKAKAQEMIMQQMRISGQAIQNARSELDYKLAEDLYQTSFDVARLNLRKLQKDIAKTDADTANVEANTALTQSNIALNSVRSKLTEAQYVRIMKELPGVIANSSILEKAASEYEEYGIRQSDPLWARALVECLDRVLPDKKQKAEVLEGIARGATVPIWKQVIDLFK